MTVLFDHPSATRRIPPPRHRATVAADWTAIAAHARRLAASTQTPPPVAGPLPSARVRFSVRSADLLLGTLALLLAAPIVALLAVVVASTSRGLPLTRTWQVGRRGELFACLRLRTMRHDADSQLPGILAANRRLADEYRMTGSLHRDPRLTAVGRLLRATHLDALPQLVNVIAGTMSLVGPRAMAPRELAHHGTALSRVLAVKPGIIGPSQLAGHTGADPRRVAADFEYSRSRTLLGDLVLCLSAPVAVLTNRSS